MDSTAPLHELRRKQIASLAAHHLVYRQVVADSQFEVVLPSATVDQHGQHGQHGQQAQQAQQPPLVLTLVLPPAFPDIAPTLFITPVCRHPWIDPQGQVVGHVRLASWNQHVSLGRVVKDIVTELTLRPPLRSAEMPKRPPPPIPLSAQAGLAGSQQQAAVGSAMPASFGAQYPLFNTTPASGSASASGNDAVDNLFPALDAKTLEEINRLLDDEPSLDDFVDTLTQIREMKAVRNDMAKSNADIARRTLSKEDELRELRQRIQALQETHATQRRMLDELMVAQKRELARFGAGHITSMLKELVQTSESMSEMSVQSFLEGKLTEDEFIRAFKESRKVYHGHAAKLENIQGDPSFAA
ncbi:hypothetical protein BC831DRAFT_501507 [Entophlyctis helioformis]|nr:hypothetical protein BC831DRAFT_501507 [Entophlyctis helioformis]